MTIFKREFLCLKISHWSLSAHKDTFVVLTALRQKHSKGGLGGKAWFWIIVNDGGTVRWLWDYVLLKIRCSGFACDQNWGVYCNLEEIALMVLQKQVLKRRWDRKDKFLQDLPLLCCSVTVSIEHPLPFRGKLGAPFNDSFFFLFTPFITVWV